MQQDMILSKNNPHIVVLDTKYKHANAAIKMMLPRSTEQAELIP